MFKEKIIAPKFAPIYDHLFGFDLCCNPYNARALYNSIDIEKDIVIV